MKNMFLFGFVDVLGTTEWSSGDDITGQPNWQLEAVYDKYNFLFCYHLYFFYSHFGIDKNYEYLIQFSLLVYQFILFYTSVLFIFMSFL